jgi:uncharacterized protein (DUF2164 family)
MIELSKQRSDDAIASLQRYFEVNMPEPLGELPASQLLNFILEEIGPTIYNKAVEDAQTRMQVRIADISGEMYIDEFQYWSKQQTKRKQ